MQMQEWNRCRSLPTVTSYCVLLPPDVLLAPLLQTHIRAALSHRSGWNRMHGKSRGCAENRCRVATLARPASVVTAENQRPEFPRRDLHVRRGSDVARRVGAAPTPTHAKGRRARHALRWEEIGRGATLIMREPCASSVSYPRKDPGITPSAVRARASLSQSRQPALAGYSREQSNWRWRAEKCQALSLVHAARRTGL